mmetsp:Transcript_53303/g.137821  ORF Transcript_53303/g.137821 Transcript_53303/m.137821 type:complete len:282 (+) Transcript_53303:984-1829(+)
MEPQEHVPSLFSVDAPQPPPVVSCDISPSQAANSRLLSSSLPDSAKSGYISVALIKHLYVSMLQAWQLELQIFGNISLKSSSVNQLEMPSPSVKSQEGPFSLQTSADAGGVGEGGMGDGDGEGPCVGVGVGFVVVGVGAGVAPLHLQRPSRLQGHQVWAPIAQGAHSASVTAWPAELSTTAAQVAQPLHPNSGTGVGMGLACGVVVAEAGVGFGVVVALDAAVGSGVVVVIVVVGARVGFGVVVVGAGVGFGAGFGDAVGADGGSEEAHAHKSGTLHGHQV